MTRESKRISAWIAIALTAIGLIVTAGFAAANHGEHYTDRAVDALRDDTATFRREICDSIKDQREDIREIRSDIKLILRNGGPHGHQIESENKTGGTFRPGH